jgi:hypothetical protein
MQKGSLVEGGVGVRLAAGLRSSSHALPRCLWFMSGCPAWRWIMEPEAAQSGPGGSPKPFAVTFELSYLKREEMFDCSSGQSSAAYAGRAECALNRAALSPFYPRRPRAVRSAAASSVDRSPGCLAASSAE